MILVLPIIISLLLFSASAEGALVARPPQGEGLFRLSDQPGGQTKRLGAITPTGKIRNLLVVRQRGKWIGMRTPWRPARNVYWARQSRLVLREVRIKIVISRSQRKMSFWRQGKRMWSTEVVIGKPLTPTPVGLFALNDFYAAGGDLRPFVFQTTAQSRAIRNWQGGVARVALHGRHGDLRVPWGTALSNGCVRTPDWALRKIRRAARIGMPIFVQK